MSPLSPSLLASPSLLRRLASLFYDALLLLAVLMVATLLFVVLLGNATQAPLLYVLRGYLWLLAAFYFIWCWRRGGQTPAMKTWRIKLVASDGEPVSLRVASMRYVLATFGVLFLGVGLIWALLDREKLFLHDRLAGSRLVSVPKP